MGILCIITLLRDLFLEHEKCGMKKAACIREKREWRMKCKNSSGNLQRCPGPWTGLYRGLSSSTEPRRHLLIVHTI
jgi:hypothetical protein